MQCNVNRTRKYEARLGCRGQGTVRILVRRSNYYQNCDAPRGGARHSGGPNLENQNPPKILSKTKSTKMCNFSSVFAQTFFSCESADIDSVLFFTIQNGSRTFFFKLLVAWIFGLKNHPKTCQKLSPGDSKIPLENALFFNIDFFASGPRFWSLLGLQLGAKLAILASTT